MTSENIHRFRITRSFVHCVELHSIPWRFKSSEKSFVKIDITWSWSISAFEVNCIPFNLAYNRLRKHHKKKWIHSLLLVYSDRQQRNFSGLHASVVWRCSSLISYWSSYHNCLRQSFASLKKPAVPLWYNGRRKQEMIIVFVWIVYPPP